MCRTCGCNETSVGSKQSLTQNLVIAPQAASCDTMTAKNKTGSPEIFFPSHNVHSKAINMPMPSDPRRGDAHTGERVSFGDDEVLDCEGMLIGPSDIKVKIDSKLNKGSFGRVYIGHFVKSGEKVAIKAEDQGSGREKIMSEGNILRKLEGGPGIPQMFWYGMHGSQFNFLIMEYLGPSLLDLFELCKFSFSLATVLKCLKQLLPAMQYMHERNIMHRDISPRNIVIGEGENRHKLYLIDYGLAKGCTRQGQMLLPSPTRYGPFCNPFVGTPRFSSINAHRGGIIGRRDDLEALGYIFVYLLKGTLPWLNDNSPSLEEGMREIERLKIVTSVEDMCEDIPDEFATLISYARLIKYYEMPDYSSLKVLFDQLIKNSGVNIEEPFDWEVPRRRLHSQASITTGLKRSKQSLPKISCGSDDSVFKYSCNMCDADAHFRLSSA